jgi:hypothetical protein
MISHKSPPDAICCPRRPILHHQTLQPAITCQLYRRPRKVQKKRPPQVPPAFEHRTFQWDTCQPHPQPHPRRARPSSIASPCRTAAAAKSRRSTRRRSSAAPPPTATRAGGPPFDYPHCSGCNRWGCGCVSSNLQRREIKVRPPRSSSAAASVRADARQAGRLVESAARGDRLAGRSIRQQPPPPPAAAGALLRALRPVPGSAEGLLRDDEQGGRSRDGRRAGRTRAGAGAAPTGGRLGPTGPVAAPRKSRWRLGQPPRQTALGWGSARTREAPGGQLENGRAGLHPPGPAKAPPDPT